MNPARPCEPLGAPPERPAPTWTVAGPKVSIRRLRRLGASTIVVFVIGPGPGAGKSTVRDLLAGLLGLPAIGTSQVLAAILERERGWPAGTVAAQRSLDPDAQRSELRAIGDRIGPSPRPAGTRALEAGARVVEGIRRAGELQATLRSARRRGMTPFALYVGRDLSRPLDNTETADLRARADVELTNRGDLDELRSAVLAMCADLRLTDDGGVSRPQLARFVRASHAIERLDPGNFGPGTGPFTRHLAVAERVAADPSMMADPREAHFRLMHGLVPSEDLGRYRSASVLIGGDRAPSPGPHLERLMRAWQEAFSGGPATGESPVAYAWRLHDEFEVIHPFADGNGRTGRLILNAARVRAGLPWLTILPADRPWYEARIRRHREAMDLAGGG